MKIVDKVVVILVSLLLIGCSTSNSENKPIGYNKSAQEWYDTIQKSVASGDLESADKEFISFRSEHIDSPLLPTTMMILAFAHMKKEEFLLANFYLDEYLRIYPTGANGAYARFLKLKAEFLSIRDINKEQKQVLKAIQDAKNFYASNPNSPYAPLVQSIIARLEMSQYLMNEEAASLYERVGKPKAAKIYRDKNKIYPFNRGDIEAPGGFLSELSLDNFTFGL